MCFTFWWMDEKLDTRYCKVGSYSQKLDVFNCCRAFCLFVSVLGSILWRQSFFPHGGFGVTRRVLRLYDR